MPKVSAKAKATAPESPSQLEVVYRKTSDLIGYARNARTHSEAQVAQIAASIREFGFTNPILLDGNSGILAGHGRVAAARLLGLAEVPTIDLAHLTETQRRAYILADNKLALNAGWDAALLKLELDELQALDFPLALTGFEIAEVSALEAEVLPEVKGQTDEDAVPEVKPDPVTRLGDVWLLGKHRVMCGDSTSIDAVEKLMAGEKADMVFTDPPYNIASENKGVAAPVSKAHKNLMASEWDKDFCFEEVQACLLAALGENATVYVCTSHHLAPAIWAWLKAWSSYYGWCSWSKPNPMPSLMKRHWTWNAELICYGTRGRHTFNFPAEGHALSTWQIPKKNGDSGHPTEKPVAVPAHAIAFSSRSGDLVLDLFLGSGSTLIAAEQSKRRCYGMELDPTYADVIVRRWQEFTGQQATLEGDGRTFDAVAAAGRAA